MTIEPKKYDSLNEYNKDIIEQCRQTYCSRIPYSELQSYDCDQLYQLIDELYNRLDNAVDNLELYLNNCRSIFAYIEDYKGVSLLTDDLRSDEMKARLQKVKTQNEQYKQLRDRQNKLIDKMYNELL